MQISPDGSKIILSILQEGRRFVALLDTTQPGAKPRPIGHLEDMYIKNIWWKGNDLVLLYLEKDDGFAIKYEAFDLKAGKMLKLPKDFFTVTHLLPNDPENILVSLGDLKRLNLRTGKISTVEKRPDYTSRWFVNSKGEAIAALGSLDKKRFLYWRSSPSAKWQRREFEDALEPEFTFLGVHPDGKRLIARKKIEANTSAMIALDPTTMATELIFQSPEIDADGTLSWSDNYEIMAIRYETDKPRFHFLSDEAAALYAAINEAMPDTINRIESTSADRTKSIIFAHSDRDPGAYYLLDRAKKKITFIEAISGQIDPEQMGKSEYLTYKNRTGTTLHGRLTLPPQAKGKVPLIVFTGGNLFGPRSRASFSHTTQLFVTRGYAVATFDTRGTDGYGSGFDRAGAYELGKGIPQDIEDGVNALVAQGKIDENKIGLFSFYWGGITGMHTVVHCPLFKTGVNWEMPLDIEWLDYNDVAAYTRTSDEAVSELGGGRAARNYMKLIDPLNQARTLKVPSFHYYQYYAETRVVDIVSLESILKKNGVPWTLLRGKGTPLMKQAEREAEVIKGFEAAIAFLDAQIGPEKNLTASK